MRSRIDLRQVGADPLHWARLVLAVVLVSFAISYVHGVLLEKPPHGMWRTVRDQVLVLALPPPMSALGIDLEEAVNGFAGYDTRGLWRGSVTGLMVSMIGAYLVGPSLLVWGLRARARSRTQMAGAIRTWMIVGAIALGGSSVASLVPAVGEAIHAQAEFDQMVLENVKAEADDAMATELSLMAHKAQVAFFTAGEPWGLAGSWQMSDGSRRPALSIVQLIEPGADAMIADSRHAVIDGRVYEITVERTDSLTIKGLLPPPEGSARPSDDATLCSGYAVGVTPQDVTMKVLP